MRDIERCSLSSYCASAEIEFIATLISYRS